MDYGDGQITSPTEASVAVWDADRVGVWHLEETHNAAVNGYRDSPRYRNRGRAGNPISPSSRPTTSTPPRSEACRHAP